MHKAKEKQEEETVHEIPATEVRKQFGSKKIERQEL